MFEGKNIIKESSKSKLNRAYFAKNETKSKTFVKISRTYLIEQLRNKNSVNI